jgi:hypothetical protein
MSYQKGIAYVRLGGEPNAYEYSLVQEGSMTYDA